MKVRFYNTHGSDSIREGEAKSRDPSQEPGIGREIGHTRIGHSSSEFFLRFDETTLILTPSAAKLLAQDLRTNVERFESKHGRIGAPDKKRQQSKRKRNESTAKKVLKELYKSRKVSSKLSMVNTRHRRKPPKG